MHDHWVCTIITMKYRPYVRPLAVSEKAHKLLNHMVYFDQFAYKCMSTLSNHFHVCNSIF